MREEKTVFQCMGSTGKKDISAIGTLFQKYIMDEISQDEFCRKAQAIVDGF